MTNYYRSPYPYRGVNKQVPLFAFRDKWLTEYSLCVEVKVWVTGKDWRSFIDKDYKTYKKYAKCASAMEGSH